MDSSVSLMHRDPDRPWITDPDPDHPRKRTLKFEANTSALDHIEERRATCRNLYWKRFLEKLKAKYLKLRRRLRRSWSNLRVSTGKLGYLNVTYLKPCLNGVQHRLANNSNLYRVMSWVISIYFYFYLFYFSINHTQR